MASILTSDQSNLELEKAATQTNNQQNQYYSFIWKIPFEFSHANSAGLSHLSSPLTFVYIARSLFIVYESLAIEITSEYESTQ